MNLSHVPKTFWLASNVQENWDVFSLKATAIIHLFLFTTDRKVILFMRPCGHWGPISGEIEAFENPIDTACRETREEVGFTIDHVYLTGHSFFGISPKGKMIHGITCFAFLPDDITQEHFTLKNGEISGCLFVSQNDALSIMKNTGFPEAVRGLEYLKKEKLIERVSTA